MTAAQRDSLPHPATDNSGASACPADFRPGLTSVEVHSPRANRQDAIPLPLKVAYTAFMCVLVPFYATQYGAANFLWFCDVALLVTLVAMWTESRYLISMQAVAIVAPQLLWTADFLYCMVTGSPLVGMATYMFDGTIPLFTRGLSLFHGWMPFLLLYLVHRTGYDRRAWKSQIILSWSVLAIVFLLVPGPGTPAGNVNKVFGWGDSAQTAMAPLAWLSIVMLAYPVLFYIPTHLALHRLTRPVAA